MLRSTAYLYTLKYQPSPERSKTGTSRVGRNFLRNAYRQIFTMPNLRHDVGSPGICRRIFPK